MTVGTDTATLLTRLGTPSDLGGGATVAANLSDIEAQTDDIGAAGAGLTAINLPDQTMNITGNITGNLSGSVGSVTGAVGSVTGAVGSVAAGGITAASIATDAIDADALADGAITAATFAAGAIDATAIATDAIGAAELAAGAANEIADAILARNVAGGSSTGRIVSEALYVLRNKTEIAAGTLTVYATDDTTPAFTAAVTTTAGNPISTLDPA